MITSCKTDVTTKSTFIQFVFPQFPEHLHEHVEHELLYHFEELEQGRMTLQEFAESVRASAVIREDELAQNVANKAIFEGVQALKIRRKATQQTAPPLIQVAYRPAIFPRNAMRASTVSMVGVGVSVTRPSSLTEPTRASISMGRP